MYLTAKKSLNGQTKLTGFIRQTHNYLNRQIGQIVKLTKTVKPLKLYNNAVNGHTSFNASTEEIA